ncbi:hypothetical protein L1987_09454 [Smallanthus sonchifolius]|uniref:Uncharacterized protein n=1 Tax=Smallanthus sonchifolius TaxID=185202 RepID=A0ACB9JNH0_9ASTR|nr:hypothetical protein L1987_09454 [Smallanthus sonchifolius]
MEAEDSDCDRVIRIVIIPEIQNDDKDVMMEEPVHACSLSGSKSKKVDFSTRCHSTIKDIDKELMVERGGGSRKMYKAHITSDWVLLLKLAIHETSGLDYSHNDDNRLVFTVNRYCDDS